MNLPATIANSIWGLSNLASQFAFQRALRNPKVAQLQRLQSYVLKSAKTAFGRAHGFGSIRGYEDFANRVPLTDYEDIEPWIKRIRAGESHVLTQDAVTHLVPTSGSAGARKLIPFTAGLQQEFNAAISPWINDLLRSRAIVGGPAYWSVTPATQFAAPEDSEVPIGFDEDTKYLGSFRACIARSIMAVPPELRLIQDVDSFRHVTALCLLRHRDLRLISIWHPSFLSLLLDYIVLNWVKLLSDLETGGCRTARRIPTEVESALRLGPSPRRAAELRHCDPHNPESIWPYLRVISCWGDAAAEPALASLRKSFPHVTMQPKGLLATEAIVTIPLAGRRPLAITSHFFEFINEAGAIQLSHELLEGKIYEVVVTTAGGLWRYRLQDQVQVTGFLCNTPSLKFIGRSGNVSDMAGEKLSEAFATRVLQEIIARWPTKPAFVLLAPDSSASGSGYTLYIQGWSPAGLCNELDRELRENPHYAYCRDLGQLEAPRVFTISAEGFETFAARQARSGARLGEIKPAVFSKLAGWTNVFRGSYTTRSCAPESPGVLQNQQEV